ncbi:MAG: TraB/VirB10 family protein [Candidatus Porifericomitaceae bacterium WSBS_2022_MAG_OTU9]
MNKVLLRQYMVVGGIAGGLMTLVMAGLFLSSGDNRAKRTEDVQKNFRQLGSDIDPASLWIQRAEVELEQLGKNNEQLESMLRRMEERLSAAEQKQRDLLVAPAVMEPPILVYHEEQAVAPPVVVEPEPPPVIIADQVPPLPNSPFGLDKEVIDFTTDDKVFAISVLAKDTAADQPAPQQMASYLPAGSFAGAALLTGLDAPTGGNGRSNPVPVLLTLTNSGTLPNRWRHQVQECVVTAAGYGDLAAERAYMRLDRFSCVLVNGSTVDLEVSGYVVGEDGKAGLRGRVVSKQGVLIARALLAGLASGIGEGLTQSITSVGTSAIGSVQNVESGRLLEYGFARGAGKALDQVARWYLERANEVYPVIEINSGRQVELVLIEGLHLGADLLRLASKIGQAEE